MTKTHNCGTVHDKIRRIQLYHELRMSIDPPSTTVTGVNRSETPNLQVTERTERKTFTVLTLHSGLHRLKSRVLNLVIHRDGFTVRSMGLLGFDYDDLFPIPGHSLMSPVS